MTGPHYVARDQPATYPADAATRRVIVGVGILTVLVAIESVVGLLVIA